jgi:LacI family transcriptional regulator, galactose operon repressor
MARRVTMLSMANIVTGAARLVDVADAAGVSLRTASRVLNDDRRVAAGTRSRVLDAMRTLNFQPDAVARSLRAGTDLAVGFVVEAIADPFFAEVIDSVETVMARHGRPVLVASTHRDDVREQQVIQRMLHRRVAGLLLAPTSGDHSWLRTDSAPVVLIDRAAPGVHADIVDIDDRQAADDAVSHLIRYGHRRIAYVGDTSSIPTSSARLDGYRAAHARHGLPVAHDLVRSDSSSSREAAAAIAELLDRPGELSCTAVFSATTRASLGIVPVLHARSRTDIAFIGLGDFATADALTPAITVVDHSGARIGAAAAERLIDRLADPARAVEHLRLPAAIIERGSGELRP